MKIGFDFDKVFVDYPPLVPDFLIDYLYKNHKKNKEKYRIPGIFEQKIRILSHFPILRHPIQKNIEVLKRISKKRGVTVFLVSSRFSFLEKRTEVWIKKYGFDSYFQELCFNYKNQQPHIFKYQKISSLKLDHYIDDDLDLLLFLYSKKIKTKLYWLDGRLSPKNHVLPPSIIRIHKLSDIFSYIKI